MDFKFKTIITIIFFLFFIVKKSNKLKILFKDHESSKLAKK